MKIVFPIAESEKDFLIKIFQGLTVNPKFSIEFQEVVDNGKISGVQEVLANIVDYESDENYTANIHIRRERGNTYEFLDVLVETANSKYTYHFEPEEVDGKRVVFCEYIGAYRGFMEQELLPIFTPILTWETNVESQIWGMTNLETYAQNHYMLAELYWKTEAKLNRADVHPAIIQKMLDKR